MFKYYDAVVFGAAAVGSWVFALSAVLISADIALRWGFSSGISWSNDVIELGMYIATLMLAPGILAKGAHVRIDFLLTNIGKDVAAAIDRISNVIGAITAVVLFYYGARSAYISFSRGDLVVRSFIFPEWWLMLFIPFSGALLVVEFVLRMLNVRRDAETVQV